jgi:hypothetical protein
MYVSSMKSNTYPIAMPAGLLEEVRQTARATGLSMADAMRQSMKLGLPKLREQLSSIPMKPFTPKEIKAAFKEDPQWEAFESAMTNGVVSPPEE